MAGDPPLKLRHLRTFLEVARQGSVGRAAAALHVSQPAVTKALRELEAAVGATLVERIGRGIGLTEAGKVFLQHSGASLAAIRRGMDSVARANAGPPIRVGALPTVSARVMPAAIQRFLARGTGNPVKIVTGENILLLDQLRLGRLDLVIGRLAAPEQMSGLTFAHLYTERVVFVVHPGHPLLQGPLDFGRLDDFLVLMPTEESVIRPFVDRFLVEHGVAEFRIRVETVSDSFGRAFVHQTDAVWIISEGVVASDLAKGDLIALSIDTSETRGAVGLTTLASTPPPPATELLSQIIRETVDSLRL